MRAGTVAQFLHSPGHSHPLQHRMFEELMPGICTGRDGHKQA